MVQLNTGLLELLDRRSARDGVSRSQLIRQAIKAYVAEDQERVIDQEIVDGYTRMPQGGEYDVDELMIALTVDQMRQLNTEEREAGHDPW